MKAPLFLFPLRRILCGCITFLLIFSGWQPVHAQLYQPGDTVPNLTFIARRDFTRPDGTFVPAGSQVGIQDLAGRVLFLEWFAWWCPFCQAAEPEVDVGIVQWYDNLGGNPYGVEVLYLFVILDDSVPANTDSYISANMDPDTVVWNDFGASSSPVRLDFQNSGQPVFVAINAVTNSPTHQPWEVLVNHLGYGQTDFSQELASFRAIIDTVQPGVTPPQITGPGLVGDDFQLSFHADADTTYRVEGTTDQSSWTTLWTVQGSNAPVQFTHTNAPMDRYLYRVATP